MGIEQVLVERLQKLYDAYSLDAESEDTILEVIKFLGGKQVW
jgi:hypothetical protein